MTQVQATVRLQLHRGFTFNDAADTVDYYASLGISHFYVSPVTMARPGSMHGYDVVDPTRVNPELGGEDALVQLVDRLRAAGMGLIVDIVPNHMGVAGGANHYWQHMLECGPHSRYAHWFDVEWHHPSPRLNGKMLLPILGRPYAEALEAGELQLRYDDKEGRLYVGYHDHVLPLCPSSYAGVLERRPALAGIAGVFAKTSPASLDAARAQLQLLACDDAAREAIASVIAEYSASSADGVEALHGLLEQQNYRLSWWRNAAEEINWRRFFEITELAGVHVELDEVFEATHALVFELYGRGLIDGVRVDHVDGLADPQAYCRRLRSRLASLQGQRPAPCNAEPAWIVVEKILAPGEKLPRGWEVNGTTGYDFMDQAGTLLHDGEGERQLRRLWQDVTGDDADFEDHLQNARRQLLAEHFGGELNALVRAVHCYANSTHPAGCDIAPPALQRVLSAFVTSFRRYRCYVTTAQGASRDDIEVLGAALERARREVRRQDVALLEQVAGWLGLDLPSPLHTRVDEGPEGRKKGWHERAVTRFQQLTPPLAAKALEDTVFYRYGPLLSRNEVGSYPSEVSGGSADFHAANLARAAAGGQGLLATATHDHKRGEDARARLAVLSERPADWAERLRQWMSAHQHLRSTVPGPAGGLLAAPSAPDEVMLYQMLVGAWPPGLNPADPGELEQFAARMAAWQEKAVREAKQHSSWMLPHTEYEAGCRAFLMGLLCAPQGRQFRMEVAQWVRDTGPAATCNSLTQTLLRLTSPGVPDLYQGTELADFSLVDPDNRRPIDLAERVAAQEEAWLAGNDWAANLVIHGKQKLIRSALGLRRAQPALFREGAYLPVHVTGAKADHVVAFARRNGNAWALSVAVRHPWRLFATLQAGAPDWADTRLVWPDGAPAGTWTDVLGLSKVAVASGALEVSRALFAAPVALLFNGKT